MTAVLSRLREATNGAHQRLEARLDILVRVGARAGRRALVGRFHGLHAGAEAVLEPLLAGLPGLDYAARRRSAMLQEDLGALGAEPGPPFLIAAPASVPEALGLLYVLEGSALGGKVIRKALAARGQDMTGLSFLDHYGPEVGARWRSFLTVLDRESTEGDEAAMAAAVRGGLAGFAHAEAWLCPAEACA